MNENALVDLPLVISRQILSRSLDLVLLHLLGTFHVIVLPSIFLFDHFPFSSLSTRDIDAL